MAGRIGAEVRRVLLSRVGLFLLPSRTSSARYVVPKPFQLNRFCLIWFAFVSIFTRIYIFLDVSGFWFVFTSSFGCLKVTKKFNRLCASSTRKNSDFQIFSFSMFAFQLVYTFGLQFVWIVVRIGF